MREGELFYVVAALIYFAETLLNVPVGTRAFVRPLGRWRLTSPLVLRSGRGPAFVIPNPLWPASLVVTAHAGGVADVDVARSRVAMLSRSTRWLRGAQTALFSSVFGGGGLLIWWERVPAWVVFATMGAAWMVVVALTIRVARTPGLRRPPVRELAFALASPLSCMRVHDRFGRRAVDDLDADVVAAALLEGDARTELLRRALMRARLLGIGDVGVIGGLVRAVGLDPETLARPPERDPSAVAYCPVCHAQFAVADVACETCGIAKITPHAS